MDNLIVSLLAYIIDRIFGEFRFIKHPVILMGDSILWFERHFYKDSILRGLWLVCFMLLITALISVLIVKIVALLPWYVGLLITSVLASMFLAHKMLGDAVLELTKSKEPKEKLAMLVSRDTQNLSHSDVCKAGIETYAENLSDGVIAPLFYLLLFGLPGIMIYKAVNTLDSMVAYKTERFERYGKVSAYLDDLLNYLPARVTALLILLVSKPHKLFGFYKDGKKHSSPNAGMPITAMAIAIGLRLGGPTVYFNRLQDKAFFGKGRIALENSDIVKALSIGKKVDYFVILMLLSAIFYGFYT